MTSYEALVKARELIRKGWIRHKTYKCYNDAEFYCAIGALGAAKGLVVKGISSYEEIERVCSEELNYLVRVIDGSVMIDKLTTRVHVWNDEVRQSKSKVLEGFDKAIELAAKKEGINTELDSVLEEVSNEPQKELQLV